MQFMSKFVCFQICLLMKDLELGLLWILLPLNLEFQDHVFIPDWLIAGVLECRLKEPGMETFRANTNSS